MGCARHGAGSGSSSLGGLDLHNVDIATKEASALPMSPTSSICRSYRGFSGSPVFLAVRTIGRPRVAIDAKP